MIGQFIAKSRNFLSNTSPASVIMVFIGIALLTAFYLFCFKKGKSRICIIYSIAFSLSLTLIITYTLLRKPYLDFFGFNQAVSSLTSVFRGEAEALMDFGFNILLFIPFSCALSCKASAMNAVVICGITSVCVEFTQMFSKLGMFELSDLLGNIIGAIIGAVLVKLLMYLIRIIKTNLKN